MSLRVAIAAFQNGVRPLISDMFQVLIDICNEPFVRHRVCRVRNATRYSLTLEFEWYHLIPLKLLDWCHWSILQSRYWIQNFFPSLVMPSIWCGNHWSCRTFIAHWRFRKNFYITISEVLTGCSIFFDLKGVIPRAAVIENGLLSSFIVDNMELCSHFFPIWEGIKNEIVYENAIWVE